MDVRRLGRRLWSRLSNQAPRAARAQAARRAALLADDTPWDMARIAQELDTNRHVVRGWAMWQRQAAAAGLGGGLDPMRLPEPDAGDRWRAGTVRLWAIQTGRMTGDAEPARLRPPGRPRPTAVLPPEPDYGLVWRLRYVLAAGAVVWAAAAYTQRHLFIAPLRLLGEMTGSIPWPW